MSSSIELTLGRDCLEETETEFGFRHTREKWFCKPQLLQIWFLRYIYPCELLTVRPQFRHRWFIWRVEVRRILRWFWLRKGRCGATAFTCNTVWLPEICKWFHCPSSILMSKRNGWAGAIVSLRSSFWISEPYLFAIRDLLLTYLLCSRVHSFLSIPFICQRKVVLILHLIVLWWRLCSCQN